MMGKLCNGQIADLKIQGVEDDGVNCQKLRETGRGLGYIVGAISLGNFVMQGDGKEMQSGQAK